MNEPRNAANPKAIKTAGEKENRRRESELSDIRVVLQSIEGRRLMWRLMGECKVFQSIWENSARIHYLAGKQDVGTFIMNEIIAADPKAFVGLMQESAKGELVNE